MKQLPFAFLCIIMASYLNVCFAQTPNKLHYQLILRYEDGTPMASQPLNIHLKLSGDSTFIDCWYYETHAVTSNLYGQINLDIGAGAPIQGSMEAVKWYKGDVYIKYQTELPDGNSLSAAKVAPLGAVPFAMHAKSADDVFLYSEDGTRFDIDVDENGRLMVIANRPPTTGFVPSVRNGDAPLHVSFNDTTTNYPDSWLWYFGDGDTSTLQHPQHSYTNTGVYHVKLVTENGFGKDSLLVENCIQVFSPGVCPDFVFDVDGNEYSTVVVGDQCWMGEDMRALRYDDGTPVPLVADNSAWDALGYNAKAYCFYNNDDDTDYGVLYTWAAASNGETSNAVPSGVQGICPGGWHLPSDQEWANITTYLGGTGVAGGKMKEAGYDHWKSPNSGATNSSGLTFLPAGERTSSGNCEQLQYFGCWWFSIESGNSAYRRYMKNNTDNVSGGSYYKTYGYAVRCLKN